MGQRPSFSHLTGYPEAVASAQDFAPYGCTEYQTPWMDPVCVGEPCPAPLRVAMRSTLSFPVVPDRPYKILLVQFCCCRWVPCLLPPLVWLLPFIYLWRARTGFRCIVGKSRHRAHRHKNDVCVLELFGIAKNLSLSLSMQTKHNKSLDACGSSLHLEHLECSWQRHTQRGTGS